LQVLLAELIQWRGIIAIMVIVIATVTIKL